MWQAVALWASVFAAALSGCGGSNEPTSQPEDSLTQELGATAEGTAEAPAELALASWRKCADEHDFCVFQGTHKIAYGANGIFVYITNTGGIPCNNETFGDPIVGVKKACFVVD